MKYYSVKLDQAWKVFDCWEMPVCTRPFRLLSQLSLDSKERAVQILAA